MRETQDNNKPMVIDMTENCSNKSLFHYQGFFSPIGFAENKRTEEIRIQLQMFSTLFSTCQNSRIIEMSENYMLFMILY